MPIVAGLTATEDAACSVLAEGFPKLREQIETPDVHMTSGQERDQGKVLAVKHVRIPFDGFSFDVLHYDKYRIRCLV
jgi:hypothetical protein